MSSIKHRKLSLKERVQIETFLNQKRPKHTSLNRARSTISREINKWVQDKTPKERLNF